MQAAHCLKTSKPVISKTGLRQPSRKTSGNVTSVWYLKLRNRIQDPQHLTHNFIQLKDCLVLFKGWSDFLCLLRLTRVSYILKLTPVTSSLRPKFFDSLRLTLFIHRVAESDCVPHSVGFWPIVSPGILVYSWPKLRSPSYHSPFSPSLTFSLPTFLLPFFCIQISSIQPSHIFSSSFVPPS